MRLLVIGCFALWVAAVAAQAPRTPSDQAATQAPATGRIATTIYSSPSGRAFHYIEPFAARQMIRSQEIGPLIA